MTTILETIHGSHLYGLNHADSDLDVFRVVVSGRTKGRHKVTDELDLNVMPLDRFLENAFKGSHQSVEAMFSPVKTVDPRYAPLFEGFRVRGGDVYARYARTIAAFAHGTLKQRRHAVRLGLNLRDLRVYGRFNPRLSEEEKALVYSIGDTYEGDQLYRIAANL
jgi:hypothetical protein